MTKRPPFASFASATSIAVAAFVWWPATSVLMDVLSRRDPWTLGIDVANTVASYGLARFAFRGSSRSQAMLRLALGTAALNAATVCALGWAKHSAAEIVLRAVTIAALTAGGAVILLALVWQFIQTRSDEGADRALARAGSWIAVPAAALVSVLAIIARKLLRRSLDLELAGAGVLHFLVPFALTCFAMVRVRMRRRWLAAVQTGRFPQWRIVRQAAEDGPLPRLVSGEGTAGTLVRVHAPEDPFREAERLEPMATVVGATCQSDEGRDVNRG